MITCRVSGPAVLVLCLLGCEVGTRFAFSKRSTSERAIAKSVYQKDERANGAVSEASILEGS